MALPTTITGAAFQGWHQGSRQPCIWQGPFLSSGGNVYGVFIQTADNKIHMYKATDPDSSFSEVDSANVPATTYGARCCLWAHQDGDILGIATGAFSATPAYKFHIFDMATDTWSATIKDIAVNSPTLVDATHGSSIAVVRRSDDSWVACFAGPSQAIMGTSYDRCHYATSTTGAVWNAAVEFDGTVGLEVHSFTGCCIVGASDRVHFFYADEAHALADETRTRSISSADVLDTSQKMAEGATWKHAQNSAVKYVSGADTVVACASVIQSVSVPFYVATFISGASPSVSYTLLPDTYTWKSFTGSAGELAVDGTRIVLFGGAFTDSSPYSVFAQWKDDGGTWTTRAARLIAGTTAPKFQGGSAVYTRNGRLVLAMFYAAASWANPTNAPVYNEFLLPSSYYQAVKQHDHTQFPKMALVG